LPSANCYSAVVTVEIMAERKRARRAARSATSKLTDVGTRVFSGDNEVFLGLNEPPPAWLNLTDEERDEALRVLLRVFTEEPIETWRELAWCVAVDAGRKRKPGRKAKWTGQDGVMLVVEVNLRLMAKGRGDDRAVGDVIEELRKAAPARYGAFSKDTLRKAYYKARPHHEKALAASRAGARSVAKLGPIK
jgi:hypothetical protein